MLRQDLAEINKLKYPVREHIKYGVRENTAGGSDTSIGGMRPLKVTMSGLSLRSGPANIYIYARSDR